MSQSPQDQPSKKKPELKKSRSQGWSWPHLVSAQSKKSAAGSLHTPDEQAEISATSNEEESLRQYSAPRSPGSVAPDTTSSAAPGSEATVSEDQNTQDAGSQDKQKADTRENEPSARKEADTQHKEEAGQSEHAKEGIAQHAQDGNEIASRQPEVKEKSSECGDECMARWTQDPCDQNNCDHGEESLRSSSDLSADAEEHTTHHEGNKGALDSSEHVIKEQPATNATADEVSYASNSSSEHQRGSPHDSPKINAVVPLENFEGGEELSRVESPIIIRDFGTPPASLKSSLKKSSTLPPPRIFIQRASDATESSTHSPTPAASEPDKQFRGPDPSEESDRTSEQSQGADPLASCIAIPPDIMSNLSHDTEDSGKRKVKKRKLVVRKSRNILMRKHFLQMCLGRELAAHTKEALRLLAKGEPVKEESAVIEEDTNITEGSTNNISRQER